PATTQSAVRACFTLIIARLPGWYASLHSFATTPSSPAPSKRASQSAALARGGRQVHGRLRAGEQLLQALAALLLRRGAQVAPARGERVEGDEGRRRLARELRHA